MDNKTLTDIISQNTSLSKEDIASLVEALTVVVAESLQEGDTIAVPSLGNFEPKMRLERIAMHPSSGKKLLVPPKLTLAFKPSSTLKQKLR